MARYNTISSNMSNNINQAGMNMANIHGQNAANWGSLGSAGLGMAGYSMGQGTAFGGKKALTPTAPSMPGSSAGYAPYASSPSTGVSSQWANNEYGM